MIWQPDLWSYNVGETRRSVRATNVAEADEAERRHSKASQEARILEHFKKGGTLTHIEAEVKFGCARLAARVNALRKRNHPIQSRMVETSSGKRVAEYSL
jgi:hypothetical protein